ncbi:MAG: 4Fe-4S binding protein [Sporomusaceae bacterium]|nr:4Fe-4S binding protein [Sporomusaceae bacterium]
MPKPVFYEERCKGCELCTAVCPKKIIQLSDRINSKGYRPSMCIDESKCIGCMLCAKTCPDMVIEIHK